MNYTETVVNVYPFSAAIWSVVYPFLSPSHNFWSCVCRYGGFHSYLLHDSQMMPYIFAASFPPSSTSAFVVPPIILAVIVGVFGCFKGCGMPVGEGVSGDLYLRFVVEFPNEEAIAMWGYEERKALEELLPAKPTFPREKRVRLFLSIFDH